MKRRTFVAISGAIGTTAMGGCLANDAAIPATLDERERTDDGVAFPSHPIPDHSDWVPARRRDEDGVFFTHLDWEPFIELDGEPEPVDGGGELDEDMGEIPIVSLPIYGGILTPFAIFGAMFYPFAGDLFAEHGESPEGILTSSLTWTDELLIFHGDFDPAVFADRYAGGFEVMDERDGFTIYVGHGDFTDGMVYAVSKDALVVGLVDDEHAHENSAEARVTAALDRNRDRRGRVVDDQDGRWLFETTGEGQMTFGLWGVEDIDAAIEPAEEVEEHVSEDPDLDEPVFDDIESVIANLSFTVEDAEMSGLEARFAGLYRDGGVPSEVEVHEHLIGHEDISHETLIGEDRVHVTATFDEFFA